MDRFIGHENECHSITYILMSILRNGDEDLFTEAIGRIKNEADKFVPASCLMMAVLYSDGIVFEKNEQKVQFYYRHAVGAGVPSQACNSGSQAVAPVEKEK